ncbi:MAG: tetratricopeptide repeat protein [Cyclobacteriaceae bacterium]
MVKLFTFSLLLGLVSLQAQELPEIGLKYGLDTLSEAEQIDFVSDNFYEIYSQSFDKAISLSEYAIILSQRNGWKDKEGFARMCFGMAHYLRGNYEEALKSYLRSSDLFDSLHHHRGIARLNNELAVFYRKQKNEEKVFACLDKSEKSAFLINDLESLGTSYHHRGVSLSQSGNSDEAFPFFEKVLEIRVQLNDSVGLGYIYLDFAEHYAKKGQIEKSLGFIDQSTKIRQELGDQQGLAVNEVIKGETLFSNEKYEAAIIHFENTIALAKPIGYTDLTRFAYDMAQQAYIKTDNPLLAYENLKTSIVFNDSLFSIEKEKALLDIQTKYETEKKEQQLKLQAAQIKTNQLITNGLIGIVILLIVIGLLQRNRLILKQQKQLEEERTRTRETQIEAALNSQELERRRFSRDLHDGFGQMISVLNLNLKSLEKGTSSKEEVFENSSQVLDEMYKELKGICFNLMPETLIKSGIIDGIKEFASRINHAGKLFIEVDAFGITKRLEDLQEISIYRITQEWINNILKYSDADKVTISLTKDEEEITLLIEDNGAGFDKNVLIYGKGNGWKNMNSRANLIKGELELDTVLGIRGSTLIVNAQAHISTEVEEMAKD